MPGKREEITAELLHIHLFMGSTLRAVKNMAKNKTKGSAEHEVHQL